MYMEVETYDDRVQYRSQLARQAMPFRLDKRPESPPKILRGERPRRENRESQSRSRPRRDRQQPEAARRPQERSRSPTRAKRAIGAPRSSSVAPPSRNDDGIRMNREAEALAIPAARGGGARRGVKISREPLNTLYTCLKRAGETQKRLNEQLV